MLPVTGLADAPTILRLLVDQARAAPDAAAPLSPPPPRR